MTYLLRPYLEDFDGVAISILSEARATAREKNGYLEELVALCSDPDPKISDGAAWILKAEADDGMRFQSTLIAPLIGTLEDIPSWQAKLTICQSVEAFELTATQANTFITWASTLADHERPFLRAWSLHARIIIATQFEKYRKAALSALEVAENDDAASVRARARNLRKLLAKKKND